MPSPRLNHPLGLTLGLLLVAVAFAAPPAFSTSKEGELKPLQLLQKTDIAMFGEVISKDAAWDGKKIYTTYEVKVHGSAKGDPATEISVRVLGGEVKHPFPVGQRVAGFPNLQPGEKIVAFLNKNDQGSYNLSGTVWAVSTHNGKDSISVPNGKLLPVDKVLQRIGRLDEALEKSKEATKARTDSKKNDH